MKLRMRENPWRPMLAVNAAVLIGVFLYKVTEPPFVPYIHLLVDYHFGFTKRALIGAVVSLFFAKIPVWLVFALAGGVWLVTLALFAELFRRTFGFDDRHLPLFVFMAGSPFFLKNFMDTLGHFGVYGCAFGARLVLVPAGLRALAGLAVLSEEFHAHAGAFRCLRLCVRALPAAVAGALRCLRGAGCRSLDDPGPDPPHSSVDVCADHPGHRGAASLSGAGHQVAKCGCRHRGVHLRRRLVLRRAILGNDDRPGS